MDSQSYFLKFVVITFGITNFVVLLAIGYFYNCDAYMLAEKLITPADRLITTNVVMSLIGATAVQLGAVLFTAAKYLFEKSP